MKTVLFCLALFFVTMSFAQQKKPLWTRYYDYKWHPENSPNVQYYTTVEKTDTGYKRLDFFVRERKVKMEGFYDNDSCTIPHGTFTYFYASGKPQSQGTYIHGKKEGLWIEVYENGRWKDSTVFKDGNKIGTSLSFFEDGSLKDSIVTGDDGFVTYVSWFENGNVNCTGRYVLGNVPVQTWLYYHANGQLASREKYKSGYLVDKQYYDEEGKSMDTTNRDREAEFPGGEKAWKKYLAKTLYFPQNFKIVNSDSARTVVAWQVGVDGSPTHVEVEVPFYKEFDQIVVNGIKKCKIKWLPAIQHNRYVPFGERQEVGFHQNVN